MDIYMGDTTIYVTTEIWRNGKLVGDIEVTSGIRQGCTGLPQFFVMVVNIVINSIIESKLCYRGEEFYIPVLFYADDVLLLARYCKGAEEMIRMVMEVAGECGLCMNKGKRSVLLYNCREGKSDEVGGMKVVSSIRNLGTDVGDTRLCFGKCQMGKIRLAKEWQI